MSELIYQSIHTGKKIDEAVSKVPALEEQINDLEAQLDDSVISETKVWSSAKTEEQIELIPKGKSAYEIYVADGGTLTESQWLASLKSAPPLFAESVEWLEDNGDTSRMYVLPDGYIYAKIEYTRGSGEFEPDFTDLIPTATFKYNQRYSKSGGTYQTIGGCTALVVPVPTGITAVTVRLKNVTPDPNYTGVYAGTSINTLTETAAEFEFGNAHYPSVDGVRTVDCTKSSDACYISFHLVGSSSSDFADVIVTANEPITYTEVMEVVEGFASTGVMYNATDYEERVIALETKVEDIDSNTDRIELLENKVVETETYAEIHNAVGTTFPPSQKPADSKIDGSDIFMDLYVVEDAVMPVDSATSDDIHAYIDAVVDNHKDRTTKEILGKDESGIFDIVRYTICDRQHIAWQKQNYPKMYAWKNSSTLIYSKSISPRIADTMYTTGYIGTSYGAVTNMSATNRSRTVGGLEFVRYEIGDVEPTLIYTNAYDDRNEGVTISQDGSTYTRYPLGDLLANRVKPIPIVIFASEHGVAPIDKIPINRSEPKMLALVAARMTRDFSLRVEKNNPLYKFIYENCMVIVIPVVNPYGFNNHVTHTMIDGYFNSNYVNINRNYDTPGWDVSKAVDGGSSVYGAYAGSENETQYTMNTMVESKAAIAMSFHGVGGALGFCLHQGQQPDGSDFNQEKLSKVNDILFNTYGIGLRYYDVQGSWDTGIPIRSANTPDVTAKSPSYITQCGAYGAILEFQHVPAGSSIPLINQRVVETAYCQALNLLAMWLSDYLE